MIKQFLVVGLLACISHNAFGLSNNDSLLNSLMQAVKQREVFVAKRIQRIDALRSRLSELRKNSREDLFQVYNALFQENKKFIYDSAFQYAHKLIQLGHQQNDEKKIGFARAQLGYVLVSSGFFKEALDTLHRVAARLLPDTARAEYYALMARAYYDLGDFNNDNFYKPFYFNLGHIYTDSARANCNPGEYYDLYLSRIKNIKTQNFAGALKDSQSILDLFALSYEQQAVNYYDLSHSYRMIGNREKAIEHLIRSARADIRSATKETAAMHALAEMLYEDGEIEYAYTFIQHAREDALFYGARQRQIQISAIEPLIASAKLNSVDEQRRKFLLFAVVLGALVILVIAFAIIIFKQLRKIKAAELAVKTANSELQDRNRALGEANQIKEEYIGYYFNVNADFLNKIEAFKKAIDQKLINKKYDDLRYIVDNINLKREREELSYGFDKVFLNLFPDFIPRFNSLFSHENRFVLKDGQLLNTEMRIFALIRMGIADSEKIAKILGYSVNTIYAYKTRVKSKSLVPNEQFEQCIMEIKAG